jgi:hypothetical protein
LYKTHFLCILKNSQKTPDKKNWVISLYRSTQPALTQEAVHDYWFPMVSKTLNPPPANRVTPVLSLNNDTRAKLHNNPFLFTRLAAMSANCVLWQALNSDAAPSVLALAHRPPEHRPTYLFFCF